MWGQHHVLLQNMQISTTTNARGGDEMENDVKMCHYYYHRAELRMFHNEVIIHVE